MPTFNDSVFTFMPPNVELYEHKVFNDADANKEMKAGSYLPIPVKPGEFVAYTNKVGQPVSKPDEWRKKGFKVTHVDGAVGFGGWSGYGRDKSDTVKIPYLAQVMMCTRGSDRCFLNFDGKAKGSKPKPYYLQLDTVGNDDDDFWATYMDRNEWKGNLLNCCLSDPKAPQCMLNGGKYMSRQHCDQQIATYCSIDDNKDDPICGCYTVPKDQVDAIRKEFKFDIDPKFWYPPCMTDKAYYNEKRKAVAAPSIQICNNVQNITGDLDLSVTGSEAVDALKQSCNISSESNTNTTSNQSGGPVSGPVPPSGPGLGDTGESSFIQDNKTKIIIAAILIGFLFMMIIVMVSVSGGGVSTTLVPEFYSSNSLGSG